jgi:hypothetical protein
MNNEGVRNLVEKQYSYKVYDGDTFLGEWTNEVITPFNYYQEINSAGSTVDIMLARKPEEVGIGTDVYLNYRVEVFVYYEDTYVWVDQAGDPVVTDDDNEIILEAGAPQGRRIFSGFISRYIPKYADNTVQVTLMSHGAELDNYMITQGVNASNLFIQTDFDGGNTTTVPFGISGTGQILGFAQSFKPSTGNAVRVVPLIWVNDPSFINGATNTLKINLVRGTPSAPIELLHSTTWNATNLSLSSAVSAYGTTPQNVIDNNLGFVIEPSVPLLSTETYYLWFEPEFPRSTMDGAAFSTLRTNSNVYADGAFFTFDFKDPPVDTGTDGFVRVLEAEVNTRVQFLSKDPADIFTSVTENYNDRGGLLTPGIIESTPFTVSYTFNTNTTLEGLQKSLELAPADWYWYVSQKDNTVNFRQRRTTPDFIFTLGREIEDIELEHTIEGLVNDVFFIGGEVGSPPANLFKRYTDTTSQETWRRGLLKISDSRVLLDATAEVISNIEIERNRNPRFRTVLDISAARFNIELLEVGDSIGFRNFGNYVDDLVLEITGLLYTPTKVTLQLDSMRPRISKRIEDLRRNQKQIEAANNPDLPA